MPANANDDYDQVRGEVETVRTLNKAPGLTVENFRQHCHQWQRLYIGCLAC